MQPGSAPNAARGQRPGRRRQAREFALQILYQGRTGGGPLEASIASFWESQGVPAPDIRAFAEELVRGAEEHRAELEERIAAVSEHWDPERMAAIDRAILHLAAFELLHREDIPPKVSINEYIEIAKKFSTEDSGAFVNGILDRIWREHGAGPGAG
ncbi:MAG TPA: transcription antitermination factor NusB [bacterium]